MRQQLTNMNIPTFEVETPYQKNKVVIKEWITGKELEYISEVIYNSMAIKESGGEIKDGSFLRKQKERAIECFVVSVNESKDNVVEAVLNMHSDDYNFVNEKIEENPKKK